MKVIQHSEEGIILFLSRDELLIVNNALNETVNGIEISEIESRVGFSEETVKELLAKTCEVVNSLNLR